MINIQNLACLELFINPNDSIVTLKKDILFNKKIQSMFGFSGTEDINIFSPYRNTSIVSYSDADTMSLFVNLIDNKNNKVITDLSIESIMADTEIDKFKELNIQRIIDFEKSHINVKNLEQYTSIILVYFAYYTEKIKLFNDEINGAVNVRIPVSNDYEDIKLSDYINHTLKNKQVKQIISFSKSNLMGYLDLVSKSKYRRIENIPICFLDKEPAMKFTFEPMLIDFENSYLRNRQTNFFPDDYYELTFIY